MSTITPLSAPTLTIGGVTIKPKARKTSPFEGTNGYKTNGVNAIQSDDSPITLVFSADEGAIIRYTFGSKKVNLGSKVYDSDVPPVLTSNGNGFDSDSTTINAKAYYQGKISDTAIFKVNILSTTFGRVADVKEGNQSKEEY